MQLSKQLTAIKKKATKEPIVHKLNQALASELWQLRELRPRQIEFYEYDWQQIWYLAFEMISGQFNLTSSYTRVIQVDAKTHELLSGSKELAAFILSGIRSIELYIYFPDLSVTTFIDIGKNR